MNKKSVCLILGLTVPMLALFQNCTDNYAIVATGADTSNAIVCNALESQSGSCVGGFKGNLYVQPRSELVPGNHCGESIPVGDTFVDDYIREDWRQNVTIQMSEMNVPARSFTEGFNVNGQPLQIESNGSQVTLIEWFGLEVEGVFHLDSTDVPGRYQFAIISDDGSNVYFKPTLNSDYQLLINNQKPASVDTGSCLRGTQGARMGCSKAFGDTSQIQTLDIGAGSSIPLKVRYYQGPREGIALTFVYRRLADAQSSNYTNCEVDMGANFSPGNSDYDGLFSDGWKIVGPGNLN